jgi:hypothetical protein
VPPDSHVHLLVLTREREQARGSKSYAAVLKCASALNVNRSRMGMNNRKLNWLVD